MSDYTYTQIDAATHQTLGDRFCIEHGDDEYGLIADSEFDRLFDHLAAALSKHGDFSEDSDVYADFNGYRYIDQHPLIQTVVGNRISAHTAITAGLEATSNSHRPLAASFDFESPPDNYLLDNYLLVISPAQVFGTFSPDDLN